jgi:large conductance mechanosensitive channel
MCYSDIHGSQEMMSDFRAFITRGNLVELAVAFIMGLAFAGVVTAFTKIVLSLVAAIFGASVSFDQLTANVNGTPIPYGAFLTALVSFLIVAFTLFILVRAYQRLVPATTATRACPFCASEISLAATRCPQCTSDVGA